MNVREDSSSSSPPQPAPPPFPPSPPPEEEDIVMSEVHLGCPPNLSGPQISRFTFSLPPVEPMDRKYIDAFKDEATPTHQVASLDEDGDLVVTRRCRQVWRAELILADFVLHKMVASSEFNGIVAIELGAGTGLVGILLARVAKTIFLTDHGDEVVDNCADNVRLNSELFHSQASVHVRELDWKDSWPPKVVENFPSKKRHVWTSAEVEELQRASLIVAADVIYSDDLTDAFFNTLERLMMQRPEKVAYLALEKRYNFTLDDLNVVANGYSRFRSYLRDEGECNDLKSRSLPCFVGKRIDLTQIPQYVREYDRGNDVELWQIKYEKRKS